LEKVPKSDEEGGVYNHLSAMPQITILQLIYQQKAYEGHAKDYEFSGTSTREHWQSGYEDTSGRSRTING
jgi:NTE family protein